MIVGAAVADSTRRGVSTSGVDVPGPCEDEAAGKDAATEPRGVSTTVVDATRCAAKAGGGGGPPFVFVVSLCLLAVA